VTPDAAAKGRAQPEDARPPLLQAQGLVAGYSRDLPIVHGVDFSVAAGEILVVLGPNGAGKSTLAKAVAGVVGVFGGAIRFDGRDITHLPPHRISASGVGFVPQTGNVFTTLSVEDNLRIGGHLLKQDLRPRLQLAYERFPDLARHRRSLGHALSGGQRQMLAIARALMTAPRLLLLDEPSAGLSPLMVLEVFEHVRSIADAGIAVLMVEQNVRAGLRIADRGMILVNGLVAHAGRAQDLRDDPAIAQLYLGKFEAAPAPATTPAVQTSA
jgi:ABC-type branched-subunit amino acid transport system ATPase component